MKNVSRNRKSFLALVGLLILIFVIQARFDDAGSGKYKTAFSKHTPTTVDANVQGESLEDEDYNCEDHLQQLPILSFEVKNASTLYSAEVILQPDLSPRKPIILISCFRI